MKLTDLFASLTPEDDETRLDGSGGLGGSTGDTGEGEDAQQGVYAALTAAYTISQEGEILDDDSDPHIGEKHYEPDDGYYKGLWDRWHPKLNPIMHRAIGLQLPHDHPAHDTSRPVHERAHALLDTVSKGAYGSGRIGYHWTDDPEYARKHLTGDRFTPGETPVIVHAQTPPRHHIEDNEHELKENRAVFDWDTHEREVPMKRNAPVHVLGISWPSRDGMHTHRFDEPITKRALRTTATMQDGDDVPSNLLNIHGHQVKVRTGGYDNVEMVPASTLRQYATQETTADRAKEVGHRIATTGEMEPLILHYHPGSGEAYLGEGNHRLRAARTLMMDRLPVRVTRANYGLPGQGAPVPRRHPEEGRGHVPYDIRPSDLGLTSQSRTAALLEPKDGLEGRDYHGHPVKYDQGNGWQHLDGSIGEGPTSSVTDFPVHVGRHVWLPHGKYWGPNSASVDQRLFDGMHLRPEIRTDILGRIDTVLGRKYPDWKQWAKVYFAGSQAAQWTDENGQGNGDFDILIGIDWPVFRAAYPKAHGSDQAIAARMTDLLWHKANQDGYEFTLADGQRVGPFDRTFFVNPVAWDIHALHPYAAYDVTDDTWAVKPIQVPADWGTDSLPGSYWNYADSLVREIKAIGTLPPEERHRMAANLWEELHTHRSDAFADGGKGLYDLSNLIEKYLDQHPAKPWAKLVEWKNQSPSGPEPWVPTTARRTTLTTLFTTAEVREDLKDPQSGEEYDGMMIALVPPEKVCKGLVVDKGEPHQSMHVTLAYLGSKDEYSAEQLAALPDLVKAWAATQKPLTSSIGGVGTFVNPAQHVLWAAVDIPHGTTFRDDLVRYLEGHGYSVRHDHGWTPHITLAYRTSHVRFLPKVEPVSWEDSRVWCCIGGRWESFDLRG